MFINILILTLTALVVGFLLMEMNQDRKDRVAKTTMPVDVDPGDDAPNNS